MRHIECSQISALYYEVLAQQALKFERTHTTMYLESLHILNIASYLYLKGDIQSSYRIIDWGSVVYTQKDQFLIAKCQFLILQGLYNEAYDVLAKLKEQLNPLAILQRIKLALLTKHEDDAKYYIDFVLHKGITKEDLLSHLIFFFSKIENVRYAEECWQAASKYLFKSTDFKIARIAYYYLQKEYTKAYDFCKALQKKEKNNLVLTLYMTQLAILTRKRKKAMDLNFYLEKIIPSSIYVKKFKHDIENI